MSCFATWQNEIIFWRWCVIDYELRGCFVFDDICIFGFFADNPYLCRAISILVELFMSITE
jgi:hypothetical protein